MGVEERYKKRREEEEKKQKPASQNSSEKKETKSLYNGVENRYLSKNINTVASDISSRIDTWFKNYNNYVSNYNSRYSTRKGTYEDSYVPDSGDWLDTITAQKSNFDKEASAIMSYLDQYGDYFGRDYTDSVKSALESAMGQQSEILKQASSDKDFWSQFADENEYLGYQSEYKKQKRYEGYQQKYAGMSYEDILAATNKLMGNEEKEWLNSNKYNLLSTAEDFGEKSKYASTYRGGEKFNAWSGTYTDSGFDDIMYDYINRDETARARQGLSDVKSNASLLGLDSSERGEMTDDEIATFNYLYATRGSEEAYAYIDYLTSDLNARQRETEEAKWAKFAKESPIASSVFSILESPLKGLSYVGQTADYLADGKIDQNEGYNKFSYINSAIRNEVTQKVEEKWGGVGSFAYQTGMSMGDFLFNTAVTGGNSAVSLAIMGTGAAADTVISSKDRGLNDNQAFLLGTIAGAAEIITEKFSIDALLDATTLGKSSVGYIVKNTLTEGSEEVGSSLINLMADILVAKDKSAWQAAIDSYIAEGMSGSEAFWHAVGDQALSLGLDFLGGAISGGLMGGGGAIVGAVGNTVQGKEYKNTYGADIGSALAGEAVEISPDSKFAQRMQTKAEGGRELSNRQIGKLVQQNETAMYENDAAAIKTAAANRLTELGESGNVDVIASALTKQVTGERLTFTEREAVKSSKFGERVANELNPENIRGGGYSSAWAEKIGTDRINADVYGRMIAELEHDATDSKFDPIIVSPPEEPKEKPTEASEGGADVREVNGATYEASEINDAQTGEIEAPEGDHIREGTKKVSETPATLKEDGKDVGVKVKEIASVSGGAITVRLDNGETVNANEIDFENEDTALVYQAAADMSTRVGGFNADTVRVFVNGFNPDAGLTAGEYVVGFRNAYRYGAEGAPISELAKDAYTSKMTEDMRNRAFHFGRAFGNDKVESAQAKLDAKKAEGLKRRSENAKIDSKTTKEGGGAMADNENTSYYDGDRNALSERQRASIEFLEKAFGNKGVKFVFFESYTDENGRRVYRNREGKVLPAPNGQYNPDGSIMIDINAGEGGEGVILNTASHELTHFIKDWSPKKFRTFAEFLYEQYGDSNVPLEAFIQRKISKAKERGRTLSRDVAYEEFVADSSEMMLVDILNNKNEENLGKLLAKDKSLFEKIKEFFADLFKRIKAAYEGVNPQSLEGSYIREMRDVADRLQTMWTEALLDATDTHKAISENVEEEGGEARLSDRDSDGNELSEGQQIFFKNSKVRDAEGRLLKVYHGTPNSEFTVFDKNRVGKGNDQYGAGFYFATDKVASSHYGNRVIESYLNIKKPIKVKNGVPNLIEANIRLTSKQAYEVVKRLPDIYDAEESPLGDYFDSYWEAGAEDWMIRELAEQYRDVGYLDSDLFRYYPNELHEALRDVVGYDGVEVSFDSGEKFYVAWFDNQMKLTSNLTPTTDSDIRYSDRDAASAVALEKFGTTTNFEQAGFALPDGRMLKLSQYGLSGVKHRVIEQIYDDIRGDAAIARFIQEGNVRISAASPGIEISAEISPTVSQLNTISRFISGSLRKQGAFYLDITDAKGGNVASVAYDTDTSVSEIIYDIKEYYERGRIPNNVLYSERDSNGNTLTEEQQEFFKDSKVRNEKGDLLVMYHGTPNAGFTKFKSGTYFTQHKWYADRYQSPGASSLSSKKSADSPDTYAVYLNIKKPFDTRNQAEKDIFYNEYYRQWGTGTDLMESGLPDWLDGMDLQEFIEEMGYDYDGLILDEGGTGGYGEEVVSRGLSYVIFDPAQAKNIDNETPTDDPDIRYSLRGTNDDGIEVYETSDEIKNLPIKERQKAFLDIMKNQYRGRTAKFVRNGHAYYASFDYKDISKNIYGDKLSDKKGWKAKMNIGAEGDIFELVEHSKYDGSKPESGKNVSAHSGVEYWDYFIKTVQIDNTVYDLLANVRKKPDDQYVYSIQLNENKKIKASPSLGSPKGVLNRMLNASADIISQNDENVNSKFSERDASGNILTDEQAEFFRNSKARDKDGNLLVLYHGTANAGFTVFEPSKGRYGGNWFTTSQSDADTYAGNYNHKLFDPNETDEIRTSVGGNYTLGSWMRFDTEADRADFLRKYPNAENIKTDAEYDVLLNEAADASDWDEYDRLEAEKAENRKELKKLQRAYNHYEWEHSREATIGELFENPERFTVSDVLRAYDAYDTNNAARDEEYTKEELIEGLRAENERMIEDGDGSIEDLPFKARLPIGEEGEIVNRANSRTYAVYANAVRPYEINAKKQTLHGAGLYSLIEAAMKREQYDSVIVRDTRVGAHEEIGDVVIIKEANQVKLTSNTAPGQNDDIRYSDRDDFYETRRELKEKYGVDTEAVLTMADGYLRNYGGVLNKTQFRKQFLDLTLEAVKFMTDTSGESIGRVNDMVIETATEIVNNPAIGGELVDELRNIKKHIKDTRIKIPSGRKGDFDIVGGFDAFRKKHWGRLTLTNDGIDVDSIYPEFQELFGKSWFPDNIDTVPDQLMRIAEVASAPLGEYSENYYNSEEVVMDVAGEIFDKIQTIALKASENMTHINYRRTEDSISPRGLLANALESVAQNDIEKDKLKNYREKIGKLNAEEQKLQNLRREIKELSFATGPRDNARIEALRAEATKTANRISIYDKQLLELEASKPLRDVLARERSRAYKKAEAEGREALAKYRERAAKTQEELKRRYQESKKRGTENRRKTEIRNKIKRTVGELNDLLLHGSKNRNIKSGLQEAVAAALEAINMDTLAADERVAKYNELIAKATDPDVIESLTKTRDNIRRQGDVLGDKLEAMRKAYRDIREKDAKSEYPDYFKAEAQLIENRIESVIDKVGNTPLRNMSYAQLDAVYDMYKMVLATVRNANAVFKEGKIEDLQKNVGAVMTELSAIPKLPEERSAVGDNLRGYVWNELTPYYAFSKIGSKTFESFYWEAIKGQDVYARDISEARDVATEAREKYHYDAWDLDKIHKFKLADGREFSVSLKHMMSIYAYAKRPQAAEHMRKGGFFFNDKETFRKKGGVLTMIRDSEAGYKIDDASLAAIISAMTEEQRRYVDDMQTYLTQMGEKGNEVTRVLWGIDLFKEKVYFPLKSSRDFIYQANQPVQESSLKNDGMTKETKPGASNPIVLEAFDDVWAAHVNRMSQYHAYVLPIENLNKVLNYGTWANTDAVAVSTMLRSRFGSAANDYLNQFIGDLNGVRNSQGAKIALLSGMFTKFKKTAVAGSLSVVIQQPTAILRAQSLIDGKYFAHLPGTEKLSERWEEVKRYAPIAVIKDIGGFDAGAGRQTAEWLNADTQRGLKKISGKIDDITMLGAAKADQIGWCAIWEAIKRETLSKNPKLAPTSEEFMKLVGERFTEVIVKTQVYDSTLSRSGYMRSKNELVKMMTSFMGEPTLSANMLFDSVVQAKRGSISKKAAARTIGAVYLATTAAALAKSLIYALRDDDDDESYAEKYLQALGGSIVGDINPLTWLPGVRDVVSIFDGWEVERSDMALFQDLKNAIDGLGSENKSTWRKIEDFAGAVAGLFGLPLKNVMRTAREVYNGFENTVNGITGGKLGKAFLEGVTGKETGRSEALYDAIIAGDEARLEVYRGDYKTEDAYNSALSKALRENDERITQAAEARYNGDIAEYMRIAKEIIGEGNFSQDNVVAAINAKMAALKKAEETGTEEQTAEDKVESIYKVDDFYKAVRGGDIATAYAVREDLINVAIENGEDREDAEKAFESKLVTYVSDQYKEALVGDSEAKNMLTRYGGMTEEKAASRVRYWAFKLENPEYADLYEGAVNKYYDGYYKDGELYENGAKSYGITLDVYAEYVRETSGLSKKEDIMYIINTLPLSKEQKDALYYLNGWAKSEIRKAPWR